MYLFLSNNQIDREGSMARRAARLLALAGAGLVFTGPRLGTAKFRRNSREKFTK